MKTHSASKARLLFAALLDEAVYKKESCIITKHNRRAAAIVPFEYLELIAEQIENRIDANEVELAIEEQGDHPPMELSKVRELLKPKKRRALVKR